MSKTETKSAGAQSPLRSDLAGGLFSLNGVTKNDLDKDPFLGILIERRPIGKEQTSSHTAQKSS